MSTFARAAIGRMKKRRPMAMILLIPCDNASKFLRPPRPRGPGHAFPKEFGVYDLGERRSPRRDEETRLDSETTSVSISVALPGYDERDGGRPPDHASRLTSS